jgi:hypothetical protein
MTTEQRDAVRRIGAVDARRSRVSQGLPERIEDPAGIATLAALLRDPPAPTRRRADDHTEHTPRAAAQTNHRKPARVTPPRSPAQHYLT